MAPKAVPLIFLGVTLAIGVSLCVGGCAGGKNWYPMFLLIPAALAILCQYGIHTTSDPAYDEGMLSLEAWSFSQTVCLSSCIGLPIVLYRVNTIGSLGLGLTIAGAAVIVLGYIIYCILDRKNDEFNQFS